MEEARIRGGKAMIATLRRTLIATAARLVSAAAGPWWCSQPRPAPCCRTSSPRSAPCPPRLAPAPRRSWPEPPAPPHPTAGSPSRRPRARRPRGAPEKGPEPANPTRTPGLWPCSPTRPSQPKIIFPPCDPHRHPAVCGRVVGATGALRRSPVRGAEGFGEEGPASSDFGTYLQVRHLPSLSMRRRTWLLIGRKEPAPRHRPGRPPDHRGQGRPVFRAASRRPRQADLPNGRDGQRAVP